MSPRKSKTIVLPSGLTSSDIQDPSVLLILIVRPASRGRNSLFFFSFLIESAFTFNVSVSMDWAFPTLPAKRASRRAAVMIFIQNGVQNDGARLIYFLNRRIVIIQMVKSSLKNDFKIRD